MGSNSDSTTKKLCDFFFFFGGNLDLSDSLKVNNNTLVLG